MILPDHEINLRACHGMIDPYVAGQLQPASYDVRLAATILVPHSREHAPIDLRKPVEERADPFDIGDGFRLMPGRFILGATVERVYIPNDVVGRVEGKSTRARQGAQIHSAGYLDPGFRGNVTLEIVNIGEDPIILWPDVLIAQFSFALMTSPCRNPYSSERNHYQDSEGVVGARGTGTTWQRPRVHRILLEGDPEPWDEVTFVSRRPDGSSSVRLTRGRGSRYIENAVVVQSVLADDDLRTRGIEPESDTDYFEIVVRAK